MLQPRVNELCIPTRVDWLIMSVAFWRVPPWSASPTIWTNSLLSLWGLRQISQVPGISSSFNSCWASRACAPSEYLWRRPKRRMRWVFSHGISNLWINCFMGNHGTPQRHFLLNSVDGKRHWCMEKDNYRPNYGQFFDSWKKLKPLNISLHLGRI